MNKPEVLELTLPRHKTFLILVDLADEDDRGYVRQRCRIVELAEPPEVHDRAGPRVTMHAEVRRDLGEYFTRILDDVLSRQILELVRRALDALGPRDRPSALVPGDGVVVSRELLRRYEREMSRQGRDLDRARSRAARWKALARRLFRERVPIGRVAHEIGNALTPAEVALERLASGRGDARDLAQRAARGVRRALDFARELRRGDPSARVWRRS